MEPLDIIGAISNAIAAICAAIAICITVWSYKTDQTAHKIERTISKLSELYKQTIIDTMLQNMDDIIKQLNIGLHQMSSIKIDDEILQQFSQNIMSEMHFFLWEIEFVKLFNQKLYQQTKTISEHISDSYSNLINKSSKRKYIPPYFEESIQKDWVELKRAIYECYIKENFDPN